MTNEISLIEFYEDKIPAITKDGEMYVAMRHITDALGLDWSGQRKQQEAALRIELDSQQDQRKIA